MMRDEAFKLMSESDHAVWSPQQAKDIAAALGYPLDQIPVYRQQDTRSQFKGLKLWGINPETGVEYKEGDYADLVDPLSFLPRVCEYFGLEYQDFYGRGWQHREYVRVLHEHFYNGTGSIPEED